MKLFPMNLTVASFLIASACCGAAPVSMTDVSNKILDEQDDIPTRLPARPTTPKPTPYYDELHFTIVALSRHSFADLFAPGTTALSVVVTWQNNVYGENSLGSDSFRTLKSSVTGLYQVLSSSDAYKKLEFSTMIDKRLRDELRNEMQDLDAALDDLESVGFQFPLIRKPSGAVTVDDVLTLLHAFCQKHIDPNSGSGGLGNMTWEQLFYVPADPTCFNEAKIANTMMKKVGAARMQGQILPSPNVRFKIFMQEEYDEFFKMDSNECCCNFNTGQHAGHFRKCADLVGSECDICGGTYCCLAGVQWCPNTSHPTT